MHRAAPFLFFNGNTFAELGRELGTALFADVSPLLRREVTSAIAQFPPVVPAYAHTHPDYPETPSRWEPLFTPFGDGADDPKAFCL